MATHLKNMNRLMKKLKSLQLIFLIILVGRGKSSESKEIEQISELPMPFRKCISPSIIVSSDLSLEDYAEDGKQYTFIKNLSLDEDPLCLSETANILVAETKQVFKDNCIYQSFYTHANKTRNILIIPNTTWNRNIHLAQKEMAKLLLKTSKKTAKIKSAYKFITNIFNRMISKGYIDDIYMDTKYIKHQLKEINLCNTTTYKLLKRKTYYINQKNLELLQQKVVHFNKIQITAERGNLLNLITRSNIKEIQRMFINETNTIIKILESRKNAYNEKTVEELKIAYNEDIIMIINSLMNKNINLHDLKICAKTKNLGICIETLKKNYMPWNENLVKFLVFSMITCNNVVEENAEYLRNKIKTCSLIINDNLKNKRQDEYNGYINMFIIQNIFKHRVQQIMNILENTTCTRKKTITYENKKIIKILADIITDIIRLDNKNNPNNPTTKEVQNDITSILSETTEEIIYFKLDNMQDELIQEKKQDIVNLVFHNLLTTQNKDALEMKEMIREIVEEILNILIFRTLHCTNYMISGIEKNIKKDEEYIRSQNSDMDLITKFVLNFIQISEDKYSSNCSFPTINMRKYSNKFISSIEHIFKREKEEIVNWMLHDITNDKILFFLEILCEFDKQCIAIDALTFYDEIWPRSAFLLLENQNNLQQKEKRMACICYSNGSGYKVHKRYIKPTDENLKAFANARTMEDISKLE